MTADVPQTTPERADLIVGCIGVAALEICKIPGPETESAGCAERSTGFEGDCQQW